MLDLGCGNETRIVFCLAGSSTSMSWGHLTNGRGMSEATKPVIKHVVFREMSGDVIVSAVATRRDMTQTGAGCVRRFIAHEIIMYHVKSSRDLSSGNRIIGCACETP